MKGNLHYPKLESLLKQPLFLSSEARERGVSSSLLNYYVRSGLIEKVQRGVYRGRQSTLNVDFKYEDLVLSVQSIPGGVVCLVSALDLYDLTDEIPREHWIAVGHERRAPKRQGVHIVRMRNESLGLSHMTLGTITIPIYDRERTIVDAFRFLGAETAMKALRKALEAKKSEQLDVKKVRAYAEKLRVSIDPYLLAASL